MKFSQALIFIACAPSAMVYAAGWGGGSVAGYSQRSQSFKERQLIQEVVEIAQCSHGKARKTLTDHGWRSDLAIDFLTSQTSGSDAQQEGANKHPGPNRQKPRKKGRSRMDRMNEGNVVFAPNKNKVGEPSHSGFEDEPTLSLEKRREMADTFNNSVGEATDEEKRIYKEAASQKENPNKVKEDDPESPPHEESENAEEGPKVIYNSDGVIKCATTTCTTLGEMLGGSFVDRMCQNITKVIACPAVTIAYSVYVCFVKCWGAIEDLECCGCDDDLRLVPEGFEMDSLKVWLSESQEATWLCLGAFTTAICKTSWFCMKNCMMGTCSCTSRNKIICCPRNLYNSVKEKYQEGIKKEHVCQCECGETCDKGCARVADCMVCCCGTAGEVLDYFMCCCHALVDNGGDLLEDAEGCQVFCELVSCCAACPGISR